MIEQERVTSVEAIVEAGLNILDREGLAHLSMRRLANLRRLSTPVQVLVTADEAILKSRAVRTLSNR